MTTVGIVAVCRHRFGDDRKGDVMAIHIHNNDLPENLDLGTSIAIDTETMGLNPHRDRLCLVQLSSGDGNAHLVKIAHSRAEAPHLNLLADSFEPNCSICTV